jgi:dihydrofolate reductase
MRPFNLIVSCSENRVIGRDGRLPWSIPEDQHFFQEKTVGEIVLMGRVCFDTWPGATQQGRQPVIVTHQPLPAGRPAQAAPTLAEALALAEALPGQIYICGGEQIYRETIAMPAATRLYLTLVHAQVEGDRHFPEWREAFPRELARREGADATWRYTFLTLGR